MTLTLRCGVCGSRSGPRPGHTGDCMCPCHTVFHYCPVSVSPQAVKDEAGPPTTYCECKPDDKFLVLSDDLPIYCSTCGKEASPMKIKDLDNLAEDAGGEFRSVSKFGTQTIPDRQCHLRGFNGQCGGDIVVGRVFFAPLPHLVDLTERYQGHYEYSCYCEKCEILYKVPDDFEWKEEG